MYAFNYLLLIDLDEFVVPRHNDTIPDMLRHLDQQKGHVLTSGQRPGGPGGPGGGGGAASGWRQHRLGGGPKVTSSYSFQNAFFYLQFPDDLGFFADGGLGFKPLPLRSLTKTRRKSKLNPQKQRSKYVCVPRRVREAGNHFIWEFVDGYNLNVPPSAGLLHHYRVCEFGGDDCVRAENRSDRTALRYGEELLASVWAVLERLREKCGLERFFQEEESGVKE